MSDADFRRLEAQIRRIAEIIQAQRPATAQQQPLTDAQRRAAQQQAIAQLLAPRPQPQAQAIGPNLAARERQRFLNAAAQRPATAQQQPITDPAQRRAARQQAISQLLAPRPQSRPQTQAQGTGMDGQSREFFERQRILNEVQRQTQAPQPQFDPSADDRIARKLNAIVRRSDISVSEVGGAIEIRTRGRMRDEVIRAITGPRTISSSTPRYR